MLIENRKQKSTEIVKRLAHLRQCVKLDKIYKAVTNERSAVIAKLINSWPRNKYYLIITSSSVKGMQMPKIQIDYLINKKNIS